ncbi:MAG TPA: hypothetical protein VMU34_08040 [Mycobacterium sp.]|nr:hypothetical protein [Mycobacterium sp.]
MNRHDELMTLAAAKSDDFLDLHISAARALISQGYPPLTTPDLSIRFMAMLDQQLDGRCEDELEHAEVSAGILCLWLATAVQRLILQEAAT